MYYVSNDYDSLILAEPFTADEYQSFDGRSKKKTWHCLPVKRMEPQKKLKLTDAPGYVFQYPVKERWGYYDHLFIIRLKNWNFSLKKENILVSM